jgi:hypothetical protein
MPLVIAGSGGYHPLQFVKTVSSGLKIPNFLYISLYQLRSSEQEIQNICLFWPSPSANSVPIKDT